MRSLTGSYTTLTAFELGGESMRKIEAEKAEKQALKKEKNAGGS